MDPGAAPIAVTDLSKASREKKSPLKGERRKGEGTKERGREGVKEGEGRRWREGDEKEEVEEEGGIRQIPISLFVSS